MKRIIRICVLLLIVALGGVWSVAWFGRQPGEPLGQSFARHVAGLAGQGAPPAAPVSGAMQLPQGVALGGAFSMTDQTGRAVTQADYAGQVLVGYFGFTFCPDVCPTELGAIAAATDLLPPALAPRVTPLFVTVDPERDTPAQMQAYVANFHPRMVGLTGTADQVAEMAKRFRVFYAKVNRPEMSEYLMDHSSFIYLIGEGGRVLTLLRPQTSPENIAAAIRAQLARS